MKEKYFELGVISKTRKIAVEQADKQHLLGYCQSLSGAKQAVRNKTAWVLSCFVGFFNSIITPVSLICFTFMYVMGQKTFMQKHDSANLKTSK